MSEITWRGKQ